MTDEGIAIAVLTALAVVLFLIGRLYRNDLRGRAQELVLLVLFTAGVFFAFGVFL